MPGEWRSVLAGRVWSLKQNETHLQYQVSHPVNQLESSDSADEAVLREYFQLDIKLCDLYEKWSKADFHFQEVSRDFSGIRMLRQDPVENLFSFICSSNNNISRISGMVERMCEKYGQKILELDGRTYYSFPTIEQLAQRDVEQHLRELGFGYRYIGLSSARVKL